MMFWQSFVVCYAFCRDANKEQKIGLVQLLSKLLLQYRVSNLFFSSAVGYKECVLAWDGS